MSTRDVAGASTGERTGPGWGPLVLGSSILLGFVAATNRWLHWNASLALVHANDEVDYRAIATAAPRWPDSKLQNQHAQRFVFHYLIGLLGRVFGVDVVYGAVTLLAVIGLVAVLCWVMRALALSTGAALVCLAVFILNAYSIRYYLIARGEVTDLLFDLGVLISLSGLFSRRYALVLSGTIVAALARQTELPAAAVLGVVFWASASARYPPSARLARAGLVPLIALVIYVAEVHVARSFSYNATPGLKSFTVLGELEALPSGAGALAQHVLRSVNGLLGAGALLIAGVSATPALRRWRSLGPEFWGCLAVAAAIAVQALALGAGYAEHNETRLSVLALGALVCALAVLLAQLERHGRRLGAGAVASLIGVLAVGSFHHLYTVVGTANAHQTVVLQLVVAVVVAIIFARHLRRARLARADSPGEVRKPGS
jgi:hypothetical protein